MRLLWLTHMIPYPPTGGNLLRTYHLLRQAARIATIDLVAFSPDGLVIEDRVKALREYCCTVEIHPIPAIAAWQKGALAIRCALSGASYTTSWTHSLSYSKAVEAALSRSCDLVVVDTIGLAKNLPENLDVPLVLNHHNEEVSMLERRARRSRGLVAAYFALEGRRLSNESRRFFRRIAKHMVVSALDLTKLKALDPTADVVVVQNGVDTGEYASVFQRAHRRPFTLLFIGAGDWYPNRDAIDWLVSDIWPRFATISDTRLILVGKNPTKVSLRAARRDPRILVTGYAEDIRPWGREADVFVCPIRDGGGTRLKILHALSMGIPVVSTRIGIEGIAAVAGRHFLEANTVDGFVSQLRRLSTDEDCCHKLSSNGRELVVNCYDWEVVGHTLRSTFTALAQERSVEGARADDGNP